MHFPQLVNCGNEIIICHTINWIYIAHFLNKGYCCYNIAGPVSVSTKIDCIYCIFLCLNLIWSILLEKKTGVNVYHTVQMIPLGLPI